MKLSPREIEIIEAVSGGQTKKEFAAAHGIAQQTVSNHICRAKIKMGCTTFEQACVKYFTAVRGSNLVRD